MIPETCRAGPGDYAPEASTPDDVRKLPGAWIASVASMTSTTKRVAGRQGTLGPGHPAGWLCRMAPTATEVQSSRLLRHVPLGKTFELFKGTRPEEQT